MDGLTLKIINGNRVALNLVKTLVTTPTLINTDPTQGEVYAIPLEVETNQKSAAADVSDSLVVSSDAKKHITDNVAPGALSWSLSGYIPGAKLLEPSNYFTPFVKLNEDILWSWFKRGAILTYKDGNAQKYERVVIKDFSTSQKSDSANAVPFTMTLKEVNVLESNIFGIANAVGSDLQRTVKSVCKIGSALGMAISKGVTIANPVAIFK